MDDAFADADDGEEEEEGGEMETKKERNKRKKNVSSDDPSWSGYQFPWWLPVQQQQGHVQQNKIATCKTQVVHDF